MLNLWHNIRLTWGVNFVIIKKMLFSRRKMENKNEKIPSDAKLNIHVSAKLENFWYHYKWHTIAGIFCFVCILILTVQLFTKTNYDIKIIYAGEKTVSTSVLTDDGKTEYIKLCEALKSVAKDYNNDGNVNINLQNIYIPSSEEYEEQTKDIQDTMKKESIKSEIQTNKKTLYDSLMYGESFLCFLSSDIFFEYEEMLDSSVFAPLSPYAKEGGDYEFASERGIYLSSLEIYKSSGLSLLPADTVVCIMLPGVFTSTGEGSPYSVSEALLRSILAFGE